MDDNEVMRILSVEEAEQKAKGNVSVIITGVTGQDGSFMADYLLKNTPYTLFGGARRLSVSNHENIAHLDGNSRFHCINFDLTDAHSIEKVIAHIKPAYFINFAAQSFVKSSWDFPAQTWDTNSKGVLHILEALHLHSPTCRFYNAGSSEEFGNVAYSPQDDKHPLRPRSPYGASKAAARQLVKVYRDSYKMYAIQGWLFNHEGTRRGEEFVTRKITKNVARIVAEIKSGPFVTPITPMELGNLGAKRDWSDAEDCVDAVWRMLNQDEYDLNIKADVCRKKIEWFKTMPTSFPDSVLIEFLSEHIKEYVVGSGENHTIREFVQIAFDYAGIIGEWQGEGVDEKFVYVRGNYTIPAGTVLVKVNPANYRPAEVEDLCGDCTPILKNLEWKPQTTFRGLVKKMVERDLGYTNFTR